MGGGGGDQHFIYSETLTCLGLGLAILEVVHFFTERVCDDTRRLPFVERFVLALLEFFMHLSMSIPPPSSFKKILDTNFLEIAMEIFWR